MSAELIIVAVLIGIFLVARLRARGRVLSAAAHVALLTILKEATYEELTEDSGICELQIQGRTLFYHWHSHRVPERGPEAILIHLCTEASRDPAGKFGCSQFLMILNRETLAAVRRQLLDETAVDLSVLRAGHDEIAKYAL